jgi:hypothetical protein
MANPINEAIEEIGKSVHDMRQKYDESLEKLEKGAEVRAKELEVEGDRWNQKIDKAYDEIKRLNEEKAKDQTRIEILEALADRPKGTPSEQLEQKELKLWEKALRKGFKDDKTNAELEDTRNKLREVKADSILSGAGSIGHIFSCKCRYFRYF